MQAAATQGYDYASLPPRRSKLLASLDRLAEAMDARRASQIADLDEMRAWLVARFYGGCADRSDSQLWRTIAKWIEREQDLHVRRQWCAMLLTVASRAGVELFHAGDARRTQQNLRALRELFRRRVDWARAVEDWKPEKLETSADFITSLSRHLFVRWKMPAFMDQVWVSPTRRARMGRDLYAHIASGRSLRRAPLPYRLTRRQAHLFMQAPSLGTYETALAWADITALGGEPTIAAELAITELGRGLLIAPHRRDYWLSVVRYLLAHPRLAQRHGGAIVDYLRQRIDGGAREGLRLHGRDPRSLLNDVRDWHRSLHAAALTPEAARRPFPDPGIGRFAGRIAAERADDDEPCWRIRRIRTAAALRVEGAAMSNCVFTYARSCTTGQCSIWSLARKTNAGDGQRIATVRVARGAIVEAKGPANRPISQAARSILERWAQQEGLRLHC